MAVFYVGLFVSRVLEQVVVIAAALPWCCVLLGYFCKDRLSIATGRNNAAAFVVPMMMPVLLLLVLAMGRSNVLDTSGVIYRGALAGLPLLLATLVLIFNISASVAQKVAAFVGMALLAWLYGGSVLALGNRVFESSSPQVFQTHVLGWHVVRGRGSLTHYLELAGWGPEPQGTNLEVDGTQYSSAHKGDVVCMGLYPGRFGFEWVHSVSCPAEGAR
jgi:hypothetical protein